MICSEPTGGCGAATCTEGKCGTATDCDDGNPCTGPDKCNDGHCEGLALAGATCDDGIFCNGAESCVAGSCVHSPKTCPSVECQVLVPCDESKKIDCHYEVVPDDKPCGSGTCCSGICVNTTTDVSNCGKCGHVCGTSYVCDGGKCVPT